jgi:putative chitinase
MTTYSRAQLFKRFQSKHGGLTMEQVDNIQFLLGKMEADPLWINAAEIAYGLATAAWETSWTFQPIDERGGKAYFEQHYGFHTAKGKRLGNTQPNDGATYHGRGYVQLTGRGNYKHATKQLAESYPDLGVDLESNPVDAKRTDVAYAVMTLGMHEGWFTGKKLSNYITSKSTNFKGARKIINGTDHDDDIAEIAQNFFDSLVARDEPAEFVSSPEAPATPPPAGADPEQVSPPATEAKVVVAAQPEKSGALKSLWVTVSGGAAAVIAWIWANIEKIFGIAKENQIDVTTVTKWAFISVGGVVSIYLFRQLVLDAIRIASSTFLTHTEAQIAANPDLHDVKIASPAPKEGDA